MSENKLLLAGLLVVALWSIHKSEVPPSPPARSSPDQVQPTPSPSIKPGKPTEGGRVAPDGTTQIQCDLPRACRKKNIPSSGLGCCVFRSGDYAGHWQNEPELFDLPEKMVQAHIPGGGYPEKVTKVFKQLAPDVQYIQDTSGDPAILQAILDSGRIACVTYNGFDCHYGQQSIAHMVCLVHFDLKTGWACVSDNNFVEENQFVWMSTNEFVKRWKGGGGGGWVYCLLKPPPPPVPHN